MSAPSANSQDAVGHKNTYVDKRANTFIIAAVVLFGLLAVLLVIVQVVFSKRDVKLVGLFDFCCPDEARFLLDDLNASVDPCFNLHDFVCMNRTHDAVSSRMSPGLRSLKIQWGLVEKLPDVANTSIGITLWHLGRSCSKQDWWPEQALPEFATAVLAAANLSRTEMPLQSLTSLVHFMALMEFRFNAPVALPLTDGNRGVASDVSELTVRWRGVPVKERMDACRICLD
ncbi:hypothetical protein HPB49_021609 [Dermacentor silvarum]|uniref:Uncharacterized protein n=1 Tax=Dermacentor silvarum TaxID=543639 RepID=A0ACB8CB82_DERSI|nr:hypothetical protein HPB49_021609 [Dermacentor silvarum]